ncbi:hypothetical protein [Flaviaesturariibacter amylovorans]|uniref:DUF1772 domain-containing protein n=1 Tax=Flaviaesturariibacter amylovorans TaxID=1084520 RepID=A0ABP8HN27_9BACT
MMNRIFRFTYLPFLIVMGLVVGGALYQTISIVPFWEKDITMFRNYGHWGINYFPILSPLMSVLWLVLVVTGIKADVPNKKLFYTANLFFLLIMGSTFLYFAPFLLTHMGHPQTQLSDGELASMLHTWARWDLVRQLTGLIPFGIFIYTYHRIGAVAARPQIQWARP